MDTGSLSDIRVMNSISQPVVRLFILLTLSFHVQKFSVLMKVGYQFFPFMVTAFCVFCETVAYSKNMKIF